MCDVSWFDIDYIWMFFCGKKPIFIKLQWQLKSKQSLKTNTTSRTWTIFKRIQCNFYNMYLQSTTLLWSMVISSTFTAKQHTRISAASTIYCKTTRSARSGVPLVMSDPARHSVACTSGWSQFSWMCGSRWPFPSSYWRTLISWLPWLWCITWYNPKPQSTYHPVKFHGTGVKEHYADSRKSNIGHSLLPVIALYILIQGSYNSTLHSKQHTFDDSSNWVGGHSIWLPCFVRDIDGAHLYQLHTYSKLKVTT